jgi:hypothetical protein
LPEQIVLVLALTFTVGVRFTFTVNVFTFVHELVVPVTVYTVVRFGFTLMFVFVEVVFHTYELAPLAVKVVVLPEQIVVELADTFTVGVGLTVIVIVLTPVQLPIVPVTLYTVVKVGLTTILVLVEEVFHTYELAPLTVNVVLPPEQIVFELAEIFTVVVHGIILCMKAETPALNTAVALGS